MTNGLVKERKTIFVKGYAIQWFSSILKDTKIFIYNCDTAHHYCYVSDATLDFVADEYTVKQVATEKINEVEML